MARNCLLYYITDRIAFAADESIRRRRLLEKIEEATRAGLDYIQLREKDLPTRELESLAREAVGLIKKLRTENAELKTAFLINSRSDIALATSADGVHLRSDDLTPREVRWVWTKCGAGAPARELPPQTPLIGVSCHSPAEVAQAKANGANFAVFAPVFEKKSVQPAGLELLHEACQQQIPVLALGGVTLENAQSCLGAGAAGIAAIRLFQENNINGIVRMMREE
ncbi:MAG TPA: thiamine phosphate synthase [Candidatus Sulfotelmatobacter sp.]|nr:thiamine phosphate synthase [Candidatus Sulfotelmatobacter sp.]